MLLHVTDDASTSDDDTSSISSEDSDTIIWHHRYVPQHVRDYGTRLINGLRVIFCSYYDPSRRQLESISDHNLRERSTEQLIDFRELMCMHP